MQKEFPVAEVFEIKKVELKNPIIFAGFVGAGLVGPVAINHIITELNMVEIAVMRSKYLPPSTVFMKGRLRHPFRFYANKEGTICAIICEITLRMEGLYSLVASILDWAAQKGSKEIVILDGVASTEHDGKAYCAAEEDLVRTMADKDISMIPQGFITGIPGGILNECLVREIQGLTLLAKANKEKRVAFFYSLSAPERSLVITQTPQPKLNRVSQLKTFPILLLAGLPTDNILLSWKTISWLSMTPLAIS